MNLVYTEESTPGQSSGYSTRAFHTGRDSLQKRFDISPKVVGSGTIFVSEVGGAITKCNNRYRYGIRG